MRTLLGKLDTHNLPPALRHPVRVIKVLADDLMRCDLMKQASAMAYVTLLSLIPSLVAIFCVLSLFSPLMNQGTDLVGELREYVLDNLAVDSGQAVEKYLDKMLGNLSLSKIGISSFASVLVTLILLLRQIELALNRIWLVNKGRNTVTRFLYFWTFLTLGTVVLAVGIGFTTSLHVASLAGAAAKVESVRGWVLDWVMGLASAMVFFFVLYKIVPNCFVSARSALIGAVTSSILLQGAARAYGVYVRDASSYTTIYGALAQLPLFLTWLYICWIIILLGALVSWRAQEGFPVEDKNAALDRERTPLDHLRNLQVQAALPLVSLVAIYRHFAQGTGHGLSVQDVAHRLHLPNHWVTEAFDTLAAMGYIIAVLPSPAAVLVGGINRTGEATGAVTEPYLPALPADKVPLAKLQEDLARPLEEWLNQWHGELAVDFRATLQVFSSPKGRQDRTLAQALVELPA